ncbi:MAG: hypothetical protein H6538_01960 [Bacteroidales bacterium]|nr:hypothetical protein [Bacteroidales bacterium]MCB9013164.1 hypothetical protein [Bacteroidales bacterium]
MSRNKKQYRDNRPAESPKVSYRFIIPGGNSNDDNLNFLEESIKRLKKEQSENCNFLILDSEDGHLKKLIDKRSEKSESFENSNFHTIAPVKGIFNNPLPLDENCVCIWLNLDRLISAINFYDFFKSEVLNPESESLYRLNWENDKTSLALGWAVNSETSDYLLSRTVFSKKPDLEYFDWYLRQMGLDQKYLSLAGSLPYSASKFYKNLHFKFFSGLRREIKLALSGFSKERKVWKFSVNPLGRLIFTFLSLLILVVLPLISYNAGISGDEEKHYAQAEKVYNYYASSGKDTSALSDEKFKLNYYGQSFDLFTYVVIKKFHIAHIYEARHMMNGAVGAIAIICSGLLARLLFGNIAGIFTLLLMFFSPGYLGHAMNNPLDIPFALGYIFTLLQLARFLKRLPEINYGIAFLIALGIAFTISVRIGGLVLIPYIFMFSGLYLLFVRLPWKIFSKFWFKTALKGTIVLFTISLAAYFLGILAWPYALQNPLKNPFEAMKMMSNITVALRVMFEGKIIWSDSLPSNYIPKNILLTIPLLVLAGSVIAFFTLRKSRLRYWIFFLVFTVVFPVAYIIYKESNVYGAWRHLLFIYPPLVVLAGAGLDWLFRLYRNRIFRALILAAYIASMINPIFYIFRNYPNQYIYFNELAGGVKKAYKKYETDYYMVSLKQGSEWVKENILKGIPADSAQPVKIISNAPSDIIAYYFRGYESKVQLPYTRFYDRGMYDWDYGIYYCNYIDPYHITHNIWPPKNTIHTVTIDGVIICAVVKRLNKDDYKGYEMMNQALKDRSIPELNVSIELMENALKLDDHNEITYLNLAQAYILRRDFDLARKKLNELLSFYPNYEKALNLIGYSYMNEGELTGNMMLVDRAISVFNETIRVNYKFASAYHNMGLAYMVKKDERTAYRYFQKSIEINPNAKDSYYMMAAIIERQGDAAQAKKIRDYASKL